MTTSGNSGSGVNLTLGVDTQPMERGADALDRLSNSYKKTRVSLEDLQASTARLSAMQESSLTSTQRQLLALRQQAEAASEAARAERDRAAAADTVAAAGDKLIARLQDMVATYGMTKNEMLAFRAAELGVTDAARPHIEALNRMSEAAARYGVVIKNVSDIERARQQWESSNKTALAAQRIRAEADAAKEVERTQTILNAQRIRSREDAAKAAAAAAEREAQAEIEWAQRTARQKIAILEQVAAYRADPRISQQTMNATFPAPAQRDLQNYQNYRREVEETSNSHRRAHGPANSLSEALNNISFSSARARSELIVLAHEAVQGRFTRMPASMMVLAEYTNMASLAFSALGVAVITGGIVMAAAAVQIGKGTLELNEFSKAMILTNGYAGLTRDTLHDMSRAMTTLYAPIGQASEMLVTLAESGKFSKEAIEAISPAMLKFQHLTGRSTEQVVGYFSEMVKFHGKIFNDMQNQTADWAAKANDSYHFLSAAQYEHIRLLALEGRQQEAIIEIGKRFNESLNMQEERIGLLVASYRGWKMILQETAHWLQEIGKDWFNGKSNASIVEDETKKYEQLYKRRMEIQKDLSYTGLYRKKERLAEIDDLIDAQSKKLVQANQKLVAEQKAADDKAALARMNTVGVNAQRELDYLKANNKTQAQLQQDKINQAVEAAKNINLSNIATWEANYKGAKADMARQRELAIENGQITLVKAEELNAVIQGIQQKHNTKVADGRKQDLMSALDDIKSHYAQVKETISQNVDDLAHARSMGTLTDGEYYTKLEAERAKELKALTDMKDAEIAVLEKYKAKSNADAAEIRKRINGVVNDYEIAVRKLESLGIKDDREQEASEKKNYQETILAIQDKGNKEVEALQKAIDRQREQNAAIGQTNEQRIRAKRLIEEEEVAQLESDAQYLRSLLEREQFDDRSTAAFEMRLGMLDQEAEKRRQLMKLIDEGAARQAAADIQKAFDREWERTTNKIENDLTSAIVDGGGNGTKRLIDNLKKEFAQLILRPIIQPVAEGLSSLFNPNSSQSSNLFGSLMNLAASNESSSSVTSVSGGGSSMFGTASNLLTIGKQIYSGFSAGLTGSLGSTLGGYVSSFGNAIGSSYISSFGTGMGLTTAQAGAMAGTAGGAGAAATTGAATGGLTAGAGFMNALPVIGWIISGMMASNGLYKQGWDYNNGSVNKLGQNLGSGINLVDQLARKLGFSDSTANIISGLAPVSKLFGRKNPEVETSGMRGTISNNGLIGEEYANILEKGGWFRSDKRYTKTAGIDAEFSNSIISAFTQMKAVSADLAKTVNVTGVDLAGFSKTFDIVWDKDTTKREKQFTDFMSTIGDDIAKYLIPNIAEFARTGETAATTLQRLSDTFVATNQIAAILGKTAEQVFGSLGLSSDKARERLVDLAGGLDNLTTGVSSYANNYLNPQEQLAPLVKEIDSVMVSLGFSGIKTRDQFKNLVKSLDLTTEAGARNFIALMNIQDAFAKVTDAATKATDEAKAALDAINEQLLSDASDAMDRALDAVRKNAQVQEKYLDDQLKTQTEALNAQKDVVQKSLDEITGIFDSLSNAIASTKIESAEMDRARRTAAQNYLGGLQGTDLTKATGLDQALEDLSTNSTDYYKTFLDYARDQAKTANLITNLQNQSGNQKSYQERTIDNLDKQLALLEKNHDEAVARLDAMVAAAEEQVAVANGTNTVLTGLTHALSQLSVAIGAFQGIQAGTGTGVVIGADGSVSQPGYAAAAIEQLYQSILGRKSDADGLKFWTAAANNGMSLKDMANQFVNSDEYRDKNPTFGSTVISDLYRNLLGREGEAAGVEHWNSLYNSGTSIETITQGFLNSDEYRRLHPSYDVGTDFVQSDQLANIHRGERILTSMDNRKLTSTITNVAAERKTMNTALDNMANRMASMETNLSAQNLAIARATGKVAVLGQRWEKQGIPIRAVDPSKPIEVTAS